MWELGCVQFLYGKPTSSSTPHVISSDESTRPDSNQYLKDAPISIFSCAYCYMISYNYYPNKLKGYKFHSLFCVDTPYFFRLILRGKWHSRHRKNFLSRFDNFLNGFIHRVLSNRNGMIPQYPKASD